MKYLRRFGCLLLGCLLPLGAFASESEDAVLAILKPVADAAMRGDFAAGIQVMYEPLVEELGGKPKLIAAVATLKSQLEAQNLKLVRHEIGKPFRFVQGANRRYVIVPTLIEMQTPNGLMRSRGFQLGVEVAPGTWQFIDGSQMTRVLLNKYFPDFPASEKLPENSREMMPLPIGAK